MLQPPVSGTIGSAFALQNTLWTPNIRQVNDEVNLNSLQKLIVPIRNISYCMFKCIAICVYIYIYIHKRPVCVYIYICMYILYISIYLYIYVCMHAYHTCVYIYTFIKHICIMFTCMYNMICRCFLVLTSTNIVTYNYICTY